VNRPAVVELVRSIVYQQLTGKAAATIYGRFLELFGGRFPSVKRMGEVEFDALRSVGLSRQKAAAIQDLASRALDRSLKLRGWDGMSDEDVIANLTQVKGIGEWSAHMFLMFHLGRLDVWPAGDYAIQKASALLEGAEELPRRREMARLGETYSPYGTIAAFYLWASVD
jgi:3-methyladenine DNA glycosylase/8-oxoguanine DNA glycosylase